MRRFFLLITLFFCLTPIFALADTNNTKTILIPDTSRPSLGKAYRDDRSGGLIWGEVLPKQMDYTDAYQACKDRNARLPGITDYRKLRELFYYDGNLSLYSSIMPDGETVVLPGMESVFWTRDWADNYQGTYYAFNGFFGDFDELWNYDLAEVRCVYP